MKRLLLASALLALSVNGTLAQDRNGPPKMPIADIAEALNVSESAAQDCLLPDQDGAQSGERKGPPPGPPSEAQKAELLSCLSASNSALTAEKLESVMQSFGPQGQHRQ